jgi:anaerobic dimethyl sulfoxide reductase subunit B (iron-sulfur subunit)
VFEQAAFYVDLASCSGCKTCMVACLDGHNLEADLLLRRVLEFAGGGWVPLLGGGYSQDVFACYLSLSCNHCLKPACVRACPAGAMSKGAGGIVRVDEEKCSGCRACARACPYAAPRYNPARGKISKCDFCFERLLQGEEPLCVQACPMRALRCGEYAELESRFGPFLSPAFFPEGAALGPGLLVGPPRQARRMADLRLLPVNPEEL